MHPRGGARRYPSNVSLIDVRRTFCGVQDCRQNPAERLLLAHHLQVCPPFLQCQAALNISKRDKMPMRPILEVEIFNLWGIYFMRPFPPSDEKEYILVVVDYVSKWVEAILDGYYVAYKPITLSYILFLFIEMILIHCHSCVMFAMKSMSMCND